MPSGALLKWTGTNRVNNDTIITVATGGTFDNNGQTDAIGYLAEGETSPISMPL